MKSDTVNALLHVLRDTAAVEGHASAAVVEVRNVILNGRLDNIDLGALRRRLDHIRDNLSAAIAALPAGE